MSPVPQRPEALSLLLACALLGACSTPQSDRSMLEWPAYGGDRASSKFLDTEALDRDSLSSLEIAWRWNSIDNEIEQQLGQVRLRQGYFESTPLMVDRTLYVRTSYSLVAALDPRTGELLWSYDPHAYEAGRPAMFGFVGRGLAYWEDEGDRRLLFTTGHGRLMALDADDGSLIPTFGDGGQVDLYAGLRGPVSVRSMNFSSPPTICNDVVVVGSAISDGPARMEMVPGDVRAYDVRTGERLWTFHTVPQEGELGVDTWEEGAWRYSGNTNVWSMGSADEELDAVYLPTGTPTNDWYGGHRLGDNLFAETLLCLDCRTGELRWHFQAVHHGLWDYDLPAAPNLVQLEVDGRPVQAVAQVSKQGFTYVLDRRTGEPVWPIEERPVPASSIPGERTSPTQPFPTRPPPFERQGVTEEDLIDFTPELRTEAREILAQFEVGPLYTPPSFRGTVNLPGWSGGASWGGAAFDPESGFLFVGSHTDPIVAALGEPDAARSDFRYTRTRPLDVEGPDGLPLFKPPWSRVTAVDLNRGEIAWVAPFGDGPIDHPRLQGLGLRGLGSGGRIYVLATRRLVLAHTDRASENLGPADNHLRAFDKESGEMVGEVELPGTPNGALMAYVLDGRPFVVVPLGGAGAPSELVALSLPEAE